MLVFLWIFQIAFLETCYKLIRQSQVKGYASEITRSIESGDDTATKIFNISRENEMSVYVYNSTDAIMTKEYDSEYNNPSGLRDINMHVVYSYYRLAREAGENISPPRPLKKTE